MVLRISSKLHSELLALAAASPEFEVCGLLIGRDSVERIVPSANIAANPRVAFEIDPATLFAAIRAERANGAKIIGYYHSHPMGQAVPSETDRAQATADGRIWVIIAQAQMTAWALDASGSFRIISIKLTD